MPRAARVPRRFMTLLASASAWLASASTVGGCAAPPEPCDPAAALVDVPAAVDIVEGGRGIVTPRAGPDVTVGVGPLAAGFTARSRGNDLVIGAPYGIVGSIPTQLVATCDDGASAAVTLTLQVRELVVTQLPSGPPARSFAALAATDAGLVLVAGTGAGAPLADAWALERGAAGWRELAGGPQGPAAAQPLDGERVLVHDEGGGVTVVSLTAAATSLSVAGLAPTAARGAGFVHDAATQRWLSVCGADTSGVRSCDASAFAFDGESLGPWTALVPSGFSPAGRAHAVVDVDTEGRRLVLFGGGRYDGPGADSWALTLDAVEGEVAWSHLGKLEARPVGRDGACGAVDPLGRRFFVIGGRGPEGLVGAVAVYDLERGDDTWRELVPPGLPTPTEGCSAAWDAAERRLVFGYGSDDDGDRADLFALQL